MAKVELDDVANLANTTSAQSTINNNSDTIETAFDNTLSRDGSSPNSMSADIDMDSNRIINLPVPTTAGEPLRKDDQFTSTEAQQFAADAETAKNDAESALATFQGIFLGSYSSDPATDPNGNAVNEGDFYYDTANNVVKFYNGSSFVVSESNSFFPNVDANVTATEDELNTLDGITATTAELNLVDGLTVSAANLQTLLNNFDEQRVELGGDFNVGEEIICSRFGNIVTITSDGQLNHASGVSADSGTGVIPSNFRPTANVTAIVEHFGGDFTRVFVTSTGDFDLNYFDDAGAGATRTDSSNTVSLSYVITGNVT